MDSRIDQILAVSAKGAKSRDNRVFVPDHWMPTGQFYAFLVTDPLAIWIEKFGAAHGLEPWANPPYNFMEYIYRQGTAFRGYWERRFARSAVTVCQQPYHARYQHNHERTLELMDARVPVISRPALWWAPEEIYGVPDYILHTSYLETHFPEAFVKVAGQGKGYVTFEVKFIRLGEDDKKREAYYQTQSVLNSYILGQLQGWMPPVGFLVTRNETRAYPLTFQVGQALQDNPTDLPGIPIRTYRDQYQTLLRDGETYRPWLDDSLPGSSIEKALGDDDRWEPALKKYQWVHHAGGDPDALYGITPKAKNALVDSGFPSIDSLLQAGHASFQVSGEATRTANRALLQANRTGLPVIPAAPDPPPVKAFEFFVDFETFPSVMVDFDQDEPDLARQSMIFMIGVGYLEGQTWRFETFTAPQDDPAGELVLIEAFMDFLDAKTGGQYDDPDQTALYHWYQFESTQSRGAADRLNLPAAHPFRQLHWFSPDASVRRSCDLERAFRTGPFALPGAWNYRLKDVARALAAWDEAYNPNWIGDLDDGLRAVMVGVAAFQQKYKSGAKKGRVKLDTVEIQILKDYLAADCNALWQILRWMRNPDPRGRVFGAPGQVYVGWENVLKPYIEPVEDIRFARLKTGSDKPPKEIPVYQHLVRAGAKYEAIGDFQRLIWGDSVRVVETKGNWLRCWARGELGWVNKADLTHERLLEVNYVDVGQGDGCLLITPDNQRILVDAGEVINMARYLLWRFNHLNKPVKIDATVISHPDKDHYGGFTPFFEDAKALKAFKFDKIYHNGIVHRVGKDLGALDPTKTYLVEIVEDAATLKAVIDLESSSGDYPKLLRKMVAAGVTDFEMLAASPGGKAYMPGFGLQPGHDWTVEVLGPVPEPDAQGNKRLRYFMKDVGMTKNGHSVILKVVYNQVTLLLGGDLNIPAEEYLLEHYAGMPIPPEGDPDQRAAFVASARGLFQVTVAKACHHGSADFTDLYLDAVNPLATVVSSGDAESHTHPRPDALGAFGRYSTAPRPLIFSTELARSTNAETPENDPQVLQAAYLKAEGEKKEFEFIEDLMRRLGRQVAVYGNITLRTDGKAVLLAQKKETKSSGGNFVQFMLGPDKGPDGRLVYHSRH